MTQWRYYAQRVLTNEWLHTDLQIDVDSRLSELSAPGALAFTVSPDTGQLRTEDGRLLLEEWGTRIYAEAAGEIRWGGIVISSDWDGPRWKVECAGFSTYPHGMPFTSSYEAVDVDPADVVRMLWQHLQSQPDGNLDLEVVGATSARLGVPADERGEGPYRLDWQDTPDCGREIDALALEAPFDWIERHAWLDRSAMTMRHWIDIAPRHGRRRRDLTFEQGVNVVDVVQPRIEGDDFANAVLGIGAGEGADALRQETSVRDGRLRRAVVIEEKDVSSPERLRAMLRTELDARRAVLVIDQITVRDHKHARIESWQQGDIIRVDATLPWLGDVQHWARVVSTEVLANGHAVLRLGRADGG